MDGINCRWRSGKGKRRLAAIASAVRQETSHQLVLLMPVGIGAQENFPLRRNLQVVRNALYYASDGSYNQLINTDEWEAVEQQYSTGRSWVKSTLSTKSIGTSTSFFWVSDHHESSEHNRYCTHAYMSV